MAVIQVSYDQPINLILPEKDNVILLLDHKSYFDPAYQQQLLLGELASRKIKPDLVCSPFEAIGAYLKSQNPDIEGDHPIIDLEGAFCHAATISFTGGRYSLKKDSIRNNIPLAPLFEHYFHRTPHQIKELDQFLTQRTFNGELIGASVAAAIGEQSKEQSPDNKPHNKLMEVFDEELWAAIQIDHFLAFKNDILQQLSLDQQPNVQFFGLLGEVLSGRYEPSNRTAKVQGAAQLLEYGGAFYAAASTAIKLSVHSYPDDINLLVIPANTPYEEYTCPKKLPVLYAGAVTLYKDDQPICLSCNHRELSHTDLCIHLDGNQHLWATIGAQSYLL